MKCILIILSIGLIQSPLCEAAQNKHALMIKEADEISIQSVYPQVFDENNDDGIVIFIEDENLQPIVALPSKRMENLPYQQEVNAAAKHTALAPALLHAVIATESGHKAHAISPKGAFGLMQLMPATAQALNVKPKDSADKQILAGAVYLKGLIKHFHGDLTLALAAYNAGPATVEKYQNRVPPYLETQQYVRRVYRHLNTYNFDY